MFETYRMMGKLIALVLAVVGMLPLTALSEPVEHRDILALEELRAAFIAYGMANGRYPQGSNAAIYAQLCDQTSGVMRLSSAHEFVEPLDTRGRPFLFLFANDGSVVIASRSADRSALAHYVLVEALAELRAEPGATDNPDDAQRLREDH